MNSRGVYSRLLVNNTAENMGFSIYAITNILNSHRRIKENVSLWKEDFLILTLSLNTYLLFHHLR